MNGASVSASLAVSPKHYRRLYESVVLLLALNRTYQRNGNRKATDAPLNPSLQPEEIFHAFMDKLGQVCDSRPGGFTFTAFTVLQLPEGPQYVFASNRRGPVELETTKAYTYALLKSVGEMADAGDDDQDKIFESTILRDILAFCRDRVRCYLNSFADALNTCIERCDASYVADKLRPLLSASLRAKGTDLDDDEYLNCMEDLINETERLQDSNVIFFIQRKAADDKTGDTKPWSELHHVSGRLVSYRHATKVLLAAREVCPELFETFTVSYVSSSKRGPNPLPPEVQTTTDIVGRSTTADQDKARYIQLAEDAQRLHKLDKTIADQWTSSKFKPLVHGEMQLLNWLEHNGGTAPSRFFNGWSYIGGSKPTCRLCSYYFASHPSGVSTRGTHGNLYPNWRMPDSADVQGGTEEEQQNCRLQMIQKVMGRVRQDALRTLTDKVATVRVHDSNTVSSTTKRLDAGGVPLMGDRRRLVSPINGDMSTDDENVATEIIIENSNEDNSE